MLPADVIAVPEFPLNQSGKIDRHALLSLWDAKPASAAPDRGSAAHAGRDADLRYLARSS